MSKYPIDFAQWLLNDIRPWQFWREGERSFAIGIFFADLANTLGSIKSAQQAEAIATKTSRFTLWLLKRDSAKYKGR